MVEVHVTVTALAVFILILIVFLIGLLFYLYPVANKLTTIPGPNLSDAKDGNVNDVERAGSLHEYLRELHSEYGGVVAFKYGDSLVVSVADSENFAPRTQLFDQPTFLYENWQPLVGEQSFLYATGLDVFKRREAIDCKIEQSTREEYAKVFRALTNELITKWKGLPKGQHIPLSQHMKGLATKAVCQMMFGDYFKDGEKVIKLYKAWDMCWNEVIASRKKEPTKSKSELDKATKDLQALMEEAIEHQWKQNSSKKTLISGLLAASNKGLTEEQILSDVITLFTIGVQVTWAVLTWTCYYLVVETNIQEKLRKQLKSPKSLDIMPESLSEMKLLKCILKESVRCSEMFSWCGRQQDIDITINEHLVPKNTPVIEAVSVAMKHDDLWSESCQFDPSRFAGDEKSAMNPLDYLPFAFGGSRKQPNESLVYLLASVVVASLFRDCEISLAGNDIDFEDANYDSFVAMPTREEVWIATTAGGKKSGFR